MDAVLHQSLYADDTFLCFDSNDLSHLEEIVNDELDIVYKWLVSNRLTLNVKKSKFIIFSKKSVPPSLVKIMIDGTELEMCETYKYLGVNFDKNLDWKYHIKYICQKISKACGSIAKIRNCVDLDTLREVYHALVHSYVRYGIIVWGTASKTALKPLQTVVNRALRIMCFAPLGRFDANPLYEILDILKIEDIYSLEVGKYMYKVERNLLPVTIANYFTIRQPSQHRYNLRSRNTPEPTTINYKTSFGERSIQKTGNNIWRSVPDDIKESENKNSFKTLYKKFLLLNNVC